MHKVQRRTIKKKKDGHKKKEAIGGKTRKIEGNINPSKRLSIPPDFFRVGVTASTTENVLSTSSKENQENYYVLENFHGFFNKCLNLRRSERILNKSKQNRKANIAAIVGESSQNHLRTSSSGNSFNEENSPVPINRKERRSFNHKDTSHKGQDIKGKRKLKNSKSIFAEINELYAARCTESNNNQLNINKFSKNSSSSRSDIKSSFCNALFKQLKVNFNFGIGSKSILACKSRIHLEIRKIDSVLSGRTQMESTKALSNPTSYYVEDGATHDFNNWQHFSKSEWIFDTPPRQKIIPPKLEESQLKPAVLCNTRKQCQLFEWKPSLQVDVSNFDAKVDITINKTFMEHVATLNSDINQDVDMKPSSSKHLMEHNTINMFSESVSQVCDNVFKFPKPKLIENNPSAFKNVFSRPHKKMCRELSGTSQVKRKLEESLGEDIFASYQQNQLRRNSLNVGFDAKKKLFTNTNDFKINLSSSFKMDHPMTSNCQEITNDFDNDFPFLQPNNLDASNFGFCFNNSKSDNLNVFDFASNANNVS